MVRAGLATILVVIFLHSLRTSPCEPGTGLGLGFSSYSARCVPFSQKVLGRLWLPAVASVPHTPHSWSLGLGNGVDRASVAYGLCAPSKDLNQAQNTGTGLGVTRDEEGARLLRRRGLSHDAGTFPWRVKGKLKEETAPQDRGGGGSLGARDAFQAGLFQAGGLGQLSWSLQTRV